MKIVKEAYTEHYKFIVDPEYVAISVPFPDESDSTIQMSREEAKEAVDWLYNELNRVLPEVIQVKPSNIEPKVWDMPIGKVASAVHMASNGSQMPKDECSYQPRTDPATQTVELKLGDPNLAYKNLTGKGRGDGETATVDLAALNATVGVTSSRI